MMPVDVYILGDVTFRGEVIAREYKAGVFSLPDIPSAGQVITLRETVGGIVSKWAGDYLVSQVDWQCGSGFGGMEIVLRVSPVSDVV